MSNPRTCPSCGAQTSGNERFCANCGTRLPEQSAPPPDVSPTIRLGPESSEPTQALPPIPPTSTPPASTPAPTPAPDYTPPPSQQSFGVPPVEAAPPARRGLPWWVIALIATAGLCIIGCVAVFGILSLLGSQVSTVFVEVGTSLALTSETLPTTSGAGGIVDLPTTLADATPEPEPTPQAPEETPDPNQVLGSTPEVEPTRPAGAGGAIGNVGGNNANDPAQTAAAETAEALQAGANAEQTAIAATAETEQLFANATSVFRDEFVDNRNNWFTGIFQEVEEDRIEEGVFKVIWSADGSSYELYEVRELTNFIAEVDCLIYRGGLDGSCGLIFGQKDDIGFYKYELFEDYYRLFIVHAEGDPTLLVEGDPAGIVQPGAPNRLRVVKRGDEINIYLNGTLLDTITDSTYPTGKVGVSTNSYLEEGGVEIWFDNFQVWQLP